MLMLDTKTSDFSLYILDYSRTCLNNYKSYKNENNDDADSNRKDNFKIIIWCSNFNKDNARRTVGSKSLWQISNVNQLP